MTQWTTEAVFFDLDGTLADTAPDLRAAMNRLLAEEERPTIPLARFRPHVSGGAPAMLGAAFGAKPEDPGYAELRLRFLDHYEAAPCAETRLFPGVPELLDALDARGIAWGIVTNKTERFTRLVAAALGLDARAACIVSGDAVPRPKPAPDPLLHACALAGIAPARSSYVGDDLRDIQAAKAAGMRAVAAAWGYLGDGPPAGEWGADDIIERPGALLDLL
ncbi:MAG: phosphoglycolate phosphatase [Candidatus Nitricoxidivorans perseverans]|uniref:Phosphoglycolate phosphatase n=1 Tax=Candidatus Nitricoxidivorans perseverans TaxID=2975601 RepID=A0AA49IZH1_9PROT|nr:MAG: phosphoglycolate phosphatase [Candidatus Nitricoxidivorans perseverans]